MKPAWPMFMRPVKPKCTLSPIAASAKAAVVGAIAVSASSRSSCIQKSIARSSAHSLASAEQSLWSDQQDQDHQEQCSRILEVARQPDVGELHDESDDHGSGERPERGAQAAERHRCEDQQQQLAPGEPAD